MTILILYSTIPLKVKIIDDIMTDAQKTGKTGMSISLLLDNFTQERKKKIQDTGKIWREYVDIRGELLYYQYTS